MSAATTEIIARGVVRRDGQLLLVRQRTKSWSFLPGGHVEPGESVESALVRELGEELGSQTEIADFLGAVEHRYTEDETAHHEINLIFEVDITETEPVSQEDHLEVHWLPWDQLAEADARPNTLKNALVSTGEKCTPFWQGWNGVVRKGENQSTATTRRAALDELTRGAAEDGTADHIDDFVKTR